MGNLSKKNAAKDCANNAPSFSHKVTGGDGIKVVLAYQQRNSFLPLLKRNKNRKWLLSSSRTV